MNVECADTKTRVVYSARGLMELAQDLAVLFASNITCTLSRQYNIIARAVSIITPNPNNSGTGCF